MIFQKIWPKYITVTAQAFAEQSSQLMTWKFIGSKALDKNLVEFYRRKDVKVLDEGSASGRIVEHLIQNGIPAENIDGIEISPEQVKIAITKNLGAHFKVGGFKKRCFTKNTYDVITRHMVDEHLDNKDLIEVSKNTFSALKVGVRLLLYSLIQTKLLQALGLTKKVGLKQLFLGKGLMENLKKGKIILGQQKFI